LEKRNLKGVTALQNLVCFTLSTASSEATYEDFVSDVPSPFSKLDLMSYVSKRVGEAVGMLKRGGFVNSTMKKTIELTYKKKVLSVDPFADMTPEQLKESVIALIEGVHLEGMKRAIRTDDNWQVILTMQQQDLFQMIQDLFMGSHFKPSNIYMPLTVEMPACLPVVSPLTVGGNVNPNGKRDRDVAIV
jgi:hypothetical protein